MTTSVIPLTKFFGIQLRTYVHRPLLSEILFDLSSSYGFSRMYSGDLTKYRPDSIQIPQARLEILAPVCKSAISELRIS